MRPFSEQEDIKRLLQCLEECSKKLVEDFDSIKKKGELWINEKETLTYIEMKQFITEETLKILQRNISYTKSKFKNIADTAPLTDNNVTDESTIKTLDSPSIPKEEISEINFSLSLQPKRKRKMPESEKDQENLKEEMKRRFLKIQKTLDEKFAKFEKEWTVEMQAASHLMSALQTQSETLSQEIKDVKEKETNIDVNNKIELMLQVQQGFKNTLDDLSMRLSVVETKPEYFQQTIDNRIKRTSKLEGNDQVSGLSDVKCTEDSQIIIGQHEQQSSPLGEADLLTYLATCDKNPGHANFIPVSEFSLKHLPQGHQNNDTFELIKAAAHVTVRLSVTKTSKDRPEFWPNTKVPYFLYDMRGSECFRTGTGMVVKVSQGNSYDGWTVTVRTATSVVFDLSELKCTTLRLFYDTEDSPEVIIKDDFRCSIKQDVNQDTCFIDVGTWDEKIVQKLQNLVSRYDQLHQKVNTTGNNDDFMFIVSHPHGRTKQISLGQRLDRYTSKPSSNKITYSASTCPGSSGAIVHYIGHLNMNHTGCLQSGQNYCSYRGPFYRCA